MPRKRMIDPSFWRDEKIAKCNHIERLMFIGMWNFADDTGVGRASPMLIKADIFPYDSLRESDIEKSLAKLASLGVILLYEVEQQQYYHIRNFLRHQSISKPSRSNLPLPPEPKLLDFDDSGNTPGTLPEYSVSTTVPIEEKLREEKRKEDIPPSVPPRGFAPPSMEDVAAYCKERGNGIDPQRFIDFYASKGWVVGKTRMKDWRAAIRTWEGRRKEESGGTTGASPKPTTKYSVLL